jgi:ABC-type dipeptide/oligopeptide/nickel transport system permease subunit
LSAGTGLAEQAEVSQAAAEAPRSPAGVTWRRFRKHKLAVVSATFLCILFTVAILAPILAPHDPNQQDLQLAQFGQPASPQSGHWLGSDQLGRDLLSRLMHGARVSLLVGFVATGVAITLGTCLGAVAGYTGRWVDMLIMRLADMMLAFPPLLFLMAMLVAIPRTAPNIAIVIGIIGWMNVARLVRAEFLTLRTREYAEAARAIGVSPTSIMFRELLPNAMGPVIVAATLGIPTAILAESTLSFLGFGIQPPLASWGNMLEPAWSQMRDHNAWWMGLFPGLAIALTVLAFNFVGDGIRDALDPRSRLD